MIPAFWITGLLFHQIFISELKNVPLTLWMANYFWYAYPQLQVQLFQEYWLINIRRTPLQLLHSCLCFLQRFLLWFGNNFVTLIFFFIFFGIGSGMLQPMINSLLAERYGTKWIGEIKSLAMPLNVIASAASPIVMGLMIDAGSGLSELMTY